MKLKDQMALCMNSTIHLEKSEQLSKYYSKKLNRKKPFQTDFISPPSP